MKFLLISLLFLTACSSKPKLKYPEKTTSTDCNELLFQSQKLNNQLQLNTISDLFSKNCFHEVIALGQYVRSIHRDKFYKGTTEAVELFIPEGTVTEYVMESYERGYLALLMSISYLKLRNEESGLIELRKANQELSAQLYNHGKDPITIMMLAALWDRYDTSASRPLWKYLSEFPKESDQSVQELTQFAQKRIQRIDQNPSELIAWNIRGFGELPSLVWKSDFISRKKGPYRIYTKEDFPQACHEQEHLFISTKAWVDKLSHRYANEYHPFLYTKSLLRAPVGVGYGVVGVTTGVAVGASGCLILGSLATKMSDEASAEVCRLSFELAGVIINSSSDLVEYILKPDLRHWQKLPRAIVLSKNESKAESHCQKMHSKYNETVNYNF